MTLALLVGPDRDYYDPGGPNTGLTEAGATVLTWTDTIIEVNDPGVDGETITDASVSDVDADYGIGFDVIPDLVVPPPPPPVLTLVYNTATDTLELTSDQPTFATWSAGTDQISIDGESGGVYGTTGTNSAALIAPNEMHIFPGSASSSSLYWEITKVDYEQPAGTDIATWTGSVNMIVPSAYTLPASQTLQVVGLGLDNVDRLDMDFGGMSLLASNTGDPNEAATNAAFGITIISWTDTLIEFTSTMIPVGTANVIAFETYVAGYNIEYLWSNDVIDPPNGFPIFSAIP